MNGVRLFVCHGSPHRAGFQAKLEAGGRVCQPHALDARPCQSHAGLPPGPAGARAVGAAARVRRFPTVVRSRRQAEDQAPRSKPPLLVPNRHRGGKHRRVTGRLMRQRRGRSAARPCPAAQPPRLCQPTASLRPANRTTSQFARGPQGTSSAACATCPHWDRARVVLPSRRIPHSMLQPHRPHDPRPAASLRVQAWLRPRSVSKACSGAQLRPTGRQ